MIVMGNSNYTNTHCVFRYKMIYTCFIFLACPCFKILIFLMEISSNISNVKGAMVLN